MYIKFRYLLNHLQSKINEVLNLIQNADPTGETCPDTPEMLSLEGRTFQNMICISLEMHSF